MAKKATNPENLKPFVKGDPRINRKGRPKNLPDLNTIMANVLDERGADGVTTMERIFRKLSDKALAGDLRAIELIQDRAYGKALQSQKVDLATDLSYLSNEQLIVMSNHIFKIQSNGQERS